jgi:hypothetical protein
MQNEAPAQSGPSVKKVVPISPKSITFRRDGKGALKFSGEEIGSATRENVEGKDENRFDIAARLYKTSGGNYIFGVEVYDKSAEHYEFRDGVVAATLEDLWTKVDGIDPDRLWLDDDILGQVFEATELADRFVESVDYIQETKSSTPPPPPISEAEIDALNARHREFIGNMREAFELLIEQGRELKKIKDRISAEEWTALFGSHISFPSAFNFPVYEAKKYLVAGEEDEDTQRRIEDYPLEWLAEIWAS